MIDNKLLEFEKIINYNFSDKQLLKKALTHTSYANENKNNNNKNFNNERLEFLGDAVLEVITSEYLYHKYKDITEGELTKLRAKIVCEPTLAFVAKSISLGDYLYLGKGEDSSGGRNRKSILSDALESVIGAIFLDDGFEEAKKFIYDVLISHLDGESKIEKIFVDYKTSLQEIIQSKNSSTPLKYVIIDEIGPDHNKKFIAEVIYENRIIGKGEGKNKKTAEQKAAKNAIEKLK